MNDYITKNDKKFSIRKPTIDNAQEIINYSKYLFAYTDQVLTTLSEYTITVEKEKDWIDNLNNNPNALVLIAEMNSNIVGLLFFLPNSKIKNCHTGEFGISVHPIYQGLGIGQALVEILLKWGKHNKQIEKIFLQVFATNKAALELYKKTGFIEEGRHVKAVKQLDGEYIDIVQMYIDVT